jgi:hypothetical protein
MGIVIDAISKVEAQTKLANIELRADLANLDIGLKNLFEMKAPALKEITTPEELKRLITAIRGGTAGNQELTKFIHIADEVSKYL